MRNGDYSGLWHNRAGDVLPKPPLPVIGPYATRHERLVLSLHSHYWEAKSCIVNTGEATAIPTGELMLVQVLSGRSSGRDTDKPSIRKVEFHDGGWIGCISQWYDDFAPIPAGGASKVSSCIRPFIVGGCLSACQSRDAYMTAWDASRHTDHP